MRPYARLNVSDRVSVWGLAGHGTVDMSIVQQVNDATGQPERITRTDLSTRLAAISGRGTLLQADQAGGFDLARKADGRFVETTAETVANEGDTSADPSRVRLALEGSRALPVGGSVLGWAWSSACAMPAAMRRSAQVSNSAAVPSSARTRGTRSRPGRGCSRRTQTWTTASGA